jgi:ATP-dependent Clp protease ATP-binding subunit ClpA
MKEIDQIYPLTINDKIKLEKRKRNQVYSSINYLKSHSNKFDFFSSDSVKILRSANQLSKKFNQENIRSEFLLLAFFQSQIELLKIFEKFDISSELIENYISTAYKKAEDLGQNSSFFSKLKKENILNSKIEYNFEVKNIIETCIENSYRFKTPVITSEILFLTLLENEKSSSGILLKKILKNDIQWNLLRYEILKKIHYQETTLQGSISKNFRYFAYLLKLELSDNKFEKLLSKNEFSFAIEAYRDLITSKILEVNIFQVLESEIKFSILSNNFRTYSG